MTPLPDLWRAGASEHTEAQVPVCRLTWAFVVGDRQHPAAARHFEVSVVEVARHRDRASRGRHYNRPARGTSNSRERGARFSQVGPLPHDIRAGRQGLTKPDQHERLVVDVPGGGVEQLETPNAYRAVPRYGAVRRGTRASHPCSERH